MIMLETFRVGAQFFIQNYVKTIEQFCKKNKILYVLMKCSQIFKNRKKFGFEHYGVKQI